MGESIAADLFRALEMPLQPAADLAQGQALGNRLRRHLEPRNLETRARQRRVNEFEMSRALDHPRQHQTLDPSGCVDWCKSRECLLGQPGALRIFIRLGMKVRQLGIDHRCGDPVRLKQLKTLEPDGRLPGAAGARDYKHVSHDRTVAPDANDRQPAQGSYRNSGQASEYPRRMLRKMRAWWATRKERRQEKYADDHAYIDPAELQQAESDFGESQPYDVDQRTSW